MGKSPVLHSKIIGKGQALFILHGLLGMGDNWITLARKYANEGFQVHLIDQRNHGKSFHDDEMNYEEMSLDLKNYADYYQLTNFDLIGHSMGGKTAMYFAINYPEMINKLIIVDIAPKYYHPHHHFIFEAIHSVDLNTTDRRKIENSLINKLQNKAIAAFLAKNIKRNKDGTFQWKANISVLEENLDTLGESLPPLSVYKKPVLFIQGEKSPYIQKSDYKLIKAHFPEAKIVLIPNSGHWVHAEQPTLFFNKTLDFLKNID